MASIGKMIENSGRITLGLADRLVAGIEPAMFARQPIGHNGERINCNHPAFILGHLSIYPQRILTILGKDPAAAAIPAAYEELFKAGANCKDDAAGDIYPAMDDILKYFRASHTALVDALPGVADELFVAENPDVSRRERWPTLGMQVDFMIGGHLMLHLGQLSTWRRCMGLGSAM